MDGQKKLFFSVHESKQLNPNIAAGFFRAGLVERFGSGIQKIVDFCKENGNPKPAYNIQPDMITLKIKTRPENIELALGGDHGGENKVATPQITVVSVKQRRVNLLESMESNPASTVSGLSNMTGIPVRTIDRDIAWLKENGYLKREGSDRSGIWIVLKELGKEE